MKQFTISELYLALNYLKYRNSALNSVLINNSMSKCKNKKQQLSRLLFVNILIYSMKIGTIGAVKSTGPKSNLVSHIGFVGLTVL